LKDKEEELEHYKRLGEERMKSEEEKYRKEKESLRNENERQNTEFENKINAIKSESEREADFFNKQILNNQLKHQAQEEELKRLIVKLIVINLF
jgi:hypothetical protein